MRIGGVTYAVRKTRSTKKIILFLLSLIFVAVLAVVILSCYKAWALLHPGRKPLDTFSSNIVPEYRTVNFKGPDSNIVLNGWLFQSGNSGKAVILVHSYGANRLQFGIDTVILIKELLNKGYNVFTFDLRNSGESGGKDSTFGYYEKEDVKAAIRYVVSQGSEHITLMGFSTGASAAILAAAESPSVDAVIADSPYSDLKTYFLENLDKWSGLPSFPFNRTISLAIEVTAGFETGDASPLNVLADDKTPFLMLIHSRKDETIPVINSIELYQRYSALNPSGVEFWQTDYEGHASAFLMNKEEYVGRVLAFLDKVYPQSD